MGGGGGWVRFLAVRPGCPALYVALGPDGLVWRSEGGEQWIKGDRLAMPPGLPGGSVVSIYDLTYAGGRFVAVGTAGPDEGPGGAVQPVELVTRGGLTWASTDGRDWRLESVPAVGGELIQVLRLDHASDRVLGVASELGGSNAGLVASTGDSWAFTPIGDPGDQPFPFTDLVTLFDGREAVFGTSIAAGQSCGEEYGGAEWLSPDLASFSMSNLEDPCTFIQRVFRGSSRFVASAHATRADPGAGFLIVSDDGVTWTTPAGQDEELWDLAGVTTSGAFVVGGDDMPAQYSLDGVHWSELDAASGAPPPVGLAVAGDIVIACGLEACVEYTTVP